MTNQSIDPRLTHRIVFDAGEWARGATEAEAKAVFKREHSARNLKKAQVWAVTPTTVINEYGRFSGPRSEFCEPVRLY